MKRIAAIAGFSFIAALALGAAVWDGSAVAGTAADFPGDGYYGACNSFPHDTSVTVTNLENGKSVTVTITRNVDNPGVFIALSPKAANDLGMKAGTATRIRAVALVASQAESSLPPARSGGESPDPDYNPKVYVEREKAAAAAAAASVPVAAPVVAPTQAMPAAVVATEPAEKPRTRIFSSSTKPEASQSFPSSPQSVPVATALPVPDVPNAAIASAAMANAAPQKPEVVGGDTKPAPRKPGIPRLVFIEPPLPGPLSERTAVKVPGKVYADALRRPMPLNGPIGIALADPKPQFAPDELPDAVLSRVVAPARMAPTPTLAEVEAPSSLGELGTKPEAIAMARPSYAAYVEAALVEASVLAPPEAFAMSVPKKAHGVEYVAELSEAELPGTPEAVAPDRPGLAAGNDTSPPLAEAEVSGSPDAIADRKTANGSEALSELQVPEVPRPIEGIAADHPTPIAGEPQAVTLEPATPRPPAVAPAPEPAAPTSAASAVAAAPVLVPAKPSQPASVATVASPPPVGTIQPPASVPILQGLDKGSFYVQIGVYGTNEALNGAVAGFKSSNYPLAVEKLTTPKGIPAFRLFVGPLSRDESGLMLIRIRSLGYKDAYIRQGT